MDQLSCFMNLKILCILMLIKYETIWKTIQNIVVNIKSSINHIKIDLFKNLKKFMRKDFKERKTWIMKNIFTLMKFKKKRKKKIFGIISFYKSELSKEDERVLMNAHIIVALISRLKVIKNNNLRFKEWDH